LRRAAAACAVARAIARLRLRQRRRRVRPRSRRAGEPSPPQAGTAWRRRDHPHRARRGLSVRCETDGLMRTANGFPIAAYLGMLVALALAAAFIAMLAIVIWLPPRPPDVMRADSVAEHFQAGYEHTVSAGSPPTESGMVWAVRSEPPKEGDEEESNLRST